MQSYVLVLSPYSRICIGSHSTADLDFPHLQNGRFRVNGSLQGSLPLTCHQGL